MLADFRDAVRGLRAGKGTTALAFGILTLTLAAGTITFSVVNAIALRALPYPGGHSLIAIAGLPRADGAPVGAASQDYFAWREGTRSFDGLAAARPAGVIRLDVDGAAQELTLARVTANLFDVLAVQPALGRVFTPEETTPGHDSVVVLTHSAWTRSFGADPNVIGRRVTLAPPQEPEALEIIGVLPPGITYPVTAARTTEAFRPYVATVVDRDHASRGRSYSLDVVGRLRAGVTPAQARADVERVTAAVRAAYPGTSMAGGAPLVLSLHDRVVGRAKSWLLLVLAAVGCVVVVGCVNSASLLLARATIRSRELATRAALGASRARLARTLLIEGLVLAFAASASAVALGYWGVAFAKAQLPTSLARAETIAVDAPVLMASIVAAVLCGLLAGGAPALHVLRSDLFAQMKTGGAVIGGRQTRSLGAFLVGEVAFVTVLLVATILVVTSFVAVTTADLGFDRHDVMTMYVSKSLQGVPKPDRRAVASVFFADVLERARAVPGVKVAGLIGGGSAPLGGASVRYSLVIPGVGELSGEDSFETRGVSPEYFPAIGLRVLRGRAFDANDGAGAPSVAIINDLAARRYFPGRDPIGEMIIFRSGETRIVGVVQNVRLNGPEAEWRMELYVPLAQEPQPFDSAGGELVVRTIGSAPAAASAVQEAIRPALAGLTLTQPRFVDDAFRRLTADRRFNAGLMVIFGVLAIAIGAIGIYGTMAFAVAQQARSIGLRMALGASQSTVLRSVLWESLWQVGVGAAVGLIGARMIASLFTSLVFGVQTTSPAVYAAVALGLSAMGVLAAFVPARRAARVDPLVALRAE